MRLECSKINSNDLIVLSLRICAEQAVYILRSCFGGSSDVKSASRP